MLALSMKSPSALRRRSKGMAKRRTEIRPLATPSLRVAGEPTANRCEPRELGETQRYGELRNNHRRRAALAPPTGSGEHVLRCRINGLFRAQHRRRLQTAGGARDPARGDPGGDVEAAG